MVKVTVYVKMAAEPQTLALEGRWRFELRGRGFIVENPDYTPAYSARAALRDADKLAERLGLEVASTWYTLE